MKVNVCESKEAGQKNRTEKSPWLEQTESETDIGFQKQRRSPYNGGLGGVYSKRKNKGRIKADPVSDFQQLEYDYTAQLWRNVATCRQRKVA